MHILKRHLFHSICIGLSCTVDVNNKHDKRIVIVDCVAVHTQ